MVYPALEGESHLFQGFFRLQNPMVKLVQCENHLQICRGNIEHYGLDKGCRQSIQLWKVSPICFWVFWVAEFDGDAIVAQNLLSDWLECF